MNEDIVRDKTPVLPLFLLSDSLALLNILYFSKFMCSLNLFCVLIVRLWITVLPDFLFWARFTEHAQKERVAGGGEFRSVGGFTGLSVWHACQTHCNT